MVFKKTNFGLQFVKLLCVLICICMLAACGSTVKKPAIKPIPTAKQPIMLAALSFVVQVGAFKNEDNSINLENKLRAAGVDAYHFVDKDGLFKVRFGDYSSREKAVSDAEYWKQRGVIEEYFIVNLTKMVSINATPKEKADLRNRIIETAHRFEGVKYKWGGSSPATGFDCSGYTMTVYRLNGMLMPRTAREQFATGKSISKNELQKGDLVFFDTMKKGYASHVGIYLGGGRFIHAPSTGKTIQESQLEADYFRKSYLGARAYF